MAEKKIVPVEIIGDELERLRVKRPPNVKSLLLGIQLGANPARWGDEDWLRMTVRLVYGKTRFRRSSDSRSTLPP
jgi:hypothetical protein